ncbi:TerD family protein [Streptomyces sp. NPDC035033]|uniref:TerD family protein n=1 Tax=Streptomyces sp. NPDC035033 TaxID=3155368 RepID=UPI0033F5D19E
MLRGLIKGANTFVPTAALRVAVGDRVDVAALLLTEEGRVRGDADVVFHGAPVHPSGAVRLAADGDRAVGVDADLADVEEEVARVLVVASTEEGALRDVRDLSVRVLGPDGTTVVGYEVTDAGDETAMVLAELYRRAGGWKFRAVGQGYADGLAGLAANHGAAPAEAPARAVHEARKPEAPAPTAPHTRKPNAAPPTALAVSKTDTAPPATPGVSKTDTTPPATPGVSKTDTTPPATPGVSETGPVPSATPGAGGTGPVPLAAVEAPPAFAGTEAHPSDWTFGSVFEPRVLTGPGNDVIDVEGLPPGPVVVELALETQGYTGVWTLTGKNKEKDLLVNSTEENFRGRLLVVVPADGRLRLKLRADGPWQVRVLPLASARRLTEEPLESWGPDVLLHTGGTADVAFHYRGRSNFIVDTYHLAGHDDPTRLPRNIWPRLNEIGRRRETLPLPEGPVVVHLGRADGPWRARLKDLRPHSGRTDGAPVRPPEPGGARGWLRRLGR